MDELVRIRAGSDATGVADPAPRQVLILRTYGVETELLNKLSVLAGAPWPTLANSVAEGVCTTLWLAPGEWMIVNRREPLDAEFEKICKPYLHHVSDVTDAWTIFRLSGAAAVETLAKGCSLDLHPRVFAEGCCAQTLLAQIPVIIHKLSNQPAFDIYADTSLATYMKTWLSDACPSSRSH